MKYFIFLDNEITSVTSKTTSKRSNKEDVLRVSSAVTRLTLSSALSYELCFLNKIVIEADEVFSIIIKRRRVTDPEPSGRAAAAL